MKQKSKNKALRVLVLSLGLCSGLLAQNIHAAGVPVVDIAGNMQAKIQNMQTIAQWGKEAAKWAKEFAQWKEQFDQIRSGNVNAIVGIFMDKTGLASEDLLGSSYGADAAKKYLLATDGQCGKAEGITNANYQACMGERNLKAASLAEITTLQKQMEKRVTEITALLNQATGVQTPGQMQALQFKMAGLQALLQTDNSRLQLSMAAHQQRMELYRQTQNDSARAALRGNGQAVPLDSALTNIRW